MAGNVGSVDTTESNMTAAVINSVMALDYETQYFGFHPRTFTDGVYEVFYNDITSSMEAVQECLTKKFSHVLSEEEIKVRTRKVMDELIERLNKPIDKLEIYLNRNVLKIPQHVVLPEDMVHLTHPMTEEEVKKLDEDIASIEKEIKHAQIRHTILKHRINEQKHVIERMNRVGDLLDTRAGSANGGFAKMQEDVSAFAKAAKSSFQNLKKCKEIVQKKMESQTIKKMDNTLISNDVV